MTGKRLPPLSADLVLHLLREKGRHRDRTAAVAAVLCGNRRSSSLACHPCTSLSWHGYAASFRTLRLLHSSDERDKSVERLLKFALTNQVLPHVDGDEVSAGGTCINLLPEVLLHS